MRFYYASDLHLEFEDRGITWSDLILDQLPCVEPGSALILAGDVFCPHLYSENHLLLVEHFFGTVSEMFDYVFIVMGNHEHYYGSFDETASKIRHILRFWNNIVLLDKEHVSYKGIEIWGGTLWSNLNNVDPVVEWDVSRGMNDFVQIKTNTGRNFQTKDVIYENKEAVRGIFNFMEKFRDSPKIIITHHAPSWVCVPERFAHDNLSYAYCNTHLDDMLHEYSDWTWIHGHIHKRESLNFGGGTILSNARGYVGHEYMVDTFTFKPFEIGD